MGKKNGADEAAKEQTLSTAFVRVILLDNLFQRYTEHGKSIGMPTSIVFNILSFHSKECFVSSLQYKKSTYDDSPSTRGRPSCHRTW